jgi:molecular chaperone DnaK
LFDFQSEFNVSLCKFEEGIISIVDTEGDNWLGSKNNVIEAIVDETIIPHLKENYAIERYS